MVRYIHSKCRYIANERRKAGKKGCEFTITLQDVENIIFQDCYYCGIEPLQKGRGGVKYNGIDRFDNSKGYTAENCVPACGTCNRLKRKEDFAEFLARARRIVNKWGMDD